MVVIDRTALSVNELLRIHILSQVLLFVQYFDRKKPLKRHFQTFKPEKNNRQGGGMAGLS